MPLMLAYTNSNGAVEALRTVCARASWEVHTLTDNPEAMLAGQIPDAALFDLDHPLPGLEQIVSGTTESAPFLPVIFLAADPQVLPELGLGLRYHIHPDHLYDLEHILISLSIGFEVNTPLHPLGNTCEHVPRVLIVDDNPLFAGVLERTLRGLERFDVRVAYSGYQAAAMLRDFSPDIAIIDLVLGDTDGCEICALIRGNGALRDTKVIGVSGYRSGEVAVQDNARFDVFLEKPFRIRELVDTINNLLAA